MRGLAEQLLEAVERGGRVEALHPEDTFNRLIVGEALLASNNYLEAEEVFSSAIAVHGESAMLLRGRGDALAGMGCCHQALADYERALATTIARAAEHRAEAEKTIGTGQLKAAGEWSERLGRFEEAIAGLQRRRTEMLQRLNIREIRQRTMQHELRCLTLEKSIDRRLARVRQTHFELAAIPADVATTGEPTPDLPPKNRGRRP